MSSQNTLSSQNTPSSQNTLSTLTVSSTEEFGRCTDTHDYDTEEDDLIPFFHIVPNKDFIDVLSLRKFHEHVRKYRHCADYDLVLSALVRSHITSLFMLGGVELGSVLVGSSRHDWIRDMVVSARM